MPSKEILPIALIGTDAQRTINLLKRQEQEKMHFVTEKLKELALSLDHHNLFPETDFILYLKESLNEHEKSKRRLIPISDQGQGWVALTPEGQLMRVNVTINNTYYWRGELEYLEGQELIHFATLAFGQIAEIVTNQS